MPYFQPKDNLDQKRIFFEIFLSFSLSLSLSFVFSSFPSQTLNRVAKACSLEQEEEAKGKVLPFAKHPVNLTVCLAVDLMTAVLMTMQNHCQIPTNPFRK